MKKPKLDSASHFYIGPEVENEYESTESDVYIAGPEREVESDDGGNSDQDGGANSDCSTKSVSDVALFALSFVPNDSVPHRRAV